MKNPILQMMNHQNNNVQAAIQQARQIMAGNNNPMLANIMSMCQGKNPKDLFYSECQRRGVEPNDILQMLRK